jgi:hypothetical protein
MRTFQLFTTDERNAAPTLAFVTVRNIDRVLELARSTLNASRHHLAVEVHQGDEMIARFSRD